MVSRLLVNIPVVTQWIRKAGLSEGKLDNEMQVIGKRRKDSLVIYGYCVMDVKCTIHDQGSQLILLLNTRFCWGSRQLGSYLGQQVLGTWEGAEEAYSTSGIEKLPSFDSLNLPDKLRFKILPKSNKQCNQYFY